MITEESQQNRADRFARRLIEYTEQRIEEMVQRLRAERDEPGTYYLEGAVPATAEQEAKHAATMSLNVKPKGIKSFAEWRADQQGA